MESQKRFILMAIAVGIAIWLWPLSVNVETPSHLTESDFDREGLYKSRTSRSNFGLSGVRFFEASENKKHWRIDSRFAELWRKENYAYLETVNAQFFAARTGNIVQANSRYGRSFLDKDVVELEGDVLIRSQRGYEFSMAKLNYSGQVHEFKSEDLVQMKGPDTQNPSMLLRGVGMRGKIDEEHFFLNKKVVGQRKIKGGQWMKITSRRGEFYTDTQRAIFEGKVIASLPTATIQGQTLELLMAKDNESLLAKGDVFVKSKERTGHADSAFLEVGGDQIILEGNARVDAKDNQLRGRRILLYSTDDRVEVDEAEGTVVNP